MKATLDLLDSALLEMDKLTGSELLERTSSIQSDSYNSGHWFFPDLSLDLKGFFEFGYHASWLPSSILENRKSISIQNPFNRVAKSGSFFYSICLKFKYAI